MNIQKHILSINILYRISNSQSVRSNQDTPIYRDYIANNLPCFATSEKESGFSYFLRHCKTAVLGNKRCLQSSYYEATLDWR